MIKTCEICAAEYDASRANQRFCRDCGKNPELARRRYIKAELTSKRNAGDMYKPREYTCKVCGKKTISTYNRTFCSNACLQLHIVYTAKCPVCGDLLTSKGRMTGKGCCSDECTETQRLQVAKAKGRYKACQQCGEMFIAAQDESKFCSVPCYRAWMAEQKLIKPVKRDLERRCRGCGKVFTYTKEQAGLQYCSDECRQDQVRARARAATKAVKKPDENICITCKTSQSQCERFTSNFTYVPQGATQKSIRGKVVVVTCPRFT